MESMPVNLTMVMKEFNAWDEHFISVTQEKTLLENKIELAEKELDAAKERENYLLNELKSNRDLVGEMQATLTKRCDLEDENSNLRKKIKELDEKMDNIIKDHKDKLVQLEDTMDNMKTVHMEQMKDMKESLLHDASEEKTKLAGVIEEKTEEVACLNKQLVELDKVKQAEIVELKLEYDSKLLMMQKQTAKVQQTTSQMSSSSQDIFRKKLQHIKTESDREISSLKRKISEMQTKLDSQGQKSNNTSSLSLNKRKRY